MRPFLCEYVRARHIVADTAMMMLAPTVTVTVIHAILAFDARALTPPIGMLVGEDNYIYTIGAVKNFQYHFHDHFAAHCIGAHWLWSQYCRCLGKDVHYVYRSQSGNAWGDMD